MTQPYICYETLDHLFAIAVLYLAFPLGFGEFIEALVRLDTVSCPWVIEVLPICLG